MILIIKPSKQNDEGYPVITLDTQENGLPCKEAVEFMAGMLMAWGYQPSTVVEAMFEYANDRGV